MRHFTRSSRRKIVEKSVIFPAHPGLKMKMDKKKDTCTTNLAKPFESKDEEAFTAVDVAPSIVDGKNNESTAKSPLTVKVSPANCKKLLPSLSPNNIAEAVTSTIDRRRFSFLPVKMIPLLLITLGVSSLSGHPATLSDHSSKPACDALKMLGESLQKSNSMCVNSMPKSKYYFSFWYRLGRLKPPKII